MTAVDSESGDDSLLPSPFFLELGQFSTDTDTDAAEPVLAPRLLAPAPLVGRLRAVICAPEEAVSDTVRACAAAQLARLAAAGVSGADPKQWYGMTDTEHRRTAVVGRRPRGAAVTVDAADTG